MALFSYTGKTSQGKKVKDIVEASSKEEVLNQLRSNNITVIDISEANQQGRGKIKGSDLAIFSRQFASLIASGITLVKSLDILADQVEKTSFKNIIRSIRRSIQAGNSLADSLSNYPNIFSSLFINMVRVGEVSGNLDVMLDRIATYLESYEELVRKIKSAMMYPVGIIIITFIILTILMTFVVPKFKDMFEGLGGDLPGPTLMLFRVSDFIKTNIWYIIGGIILLVIGLKFFVKSRRGSELVENLKRNLPVIGSLYRKMVLARFTKTLAILLRSGVPILNSLSIAGNTSGSQQLSVDMANIRVNVSKGKKIADVLKGNPLFPSMVTSMIGVGEESGDLPGMVEKIADIYDKEVDAAVSGLLSVIEPIIIVVLGVVIGGIVICLFLPIFKISQMVQ